MHHSLYSRLGRGPRCANGPGLVLSVEEHTAVARHCALWSQLRRAILLSGIFLSGQPPLDALRFLVVGVDPLLPLLQLLHLTRLWPPIPALISVSYRRCLPLRIQGLNPLHTPKMIPSPPHQTPPPFSPLAYARSFSAPLAHQQACSRCTLLHIRRHEADPADVAIRRRCVVALAHRLSPQT